MSSQVVELFRGLLGAGDAASAGGGSGDAEVRRGVHCALRGLPSRQVDVLSLAVIEGFGTDEIVETLGIPPSVVERVLTEAMLAVLQKLAPATTN